MDKRTALALAAGFVIGSVGFWIERLVYWSIIIGLLLRWYTHG